MVDQTLSTEVLRAAKEWKDARQACLSSIPVKPSEYDRLAAAEAALQAAVVAYEKSV